MYIIKNRGKKLHKSTFLFKKKFCIGNNYRVMSKKSLTTNCYSKRSFQILLCEMLLTFWPKSKRYSATKQIEKVLSIVHNFEHNFFLHRLYFCIFDNFQNWQNFPKGTAQVAALGLTCLMMDQEEGISKIWFSGIGLLEINPMNLIELGFSSFLFLSF